MSQPELVPEQEQSAQKTEGHSFRESNKFDPVTMEDRRKATRDRRPSDRGGGRRRSDHIARKPRNYKILMVAGLAVVCSVGATKLISSWFESELSRYKSSLTEKAKPEPVIVKKIIVASKKLTYGTKITSENTKTIDWHAKNLPTGAILEGSDMLTKKGKRFAITTIEANEPVLLSKLTQPGVKASLAAMLEPGKKAVTIRVDDVFGVGGLVKPNDRVDVLWTISQNQTEGVSDKQQFTELLVRGVRVLAVDQSFADKAGVKPASSIAKSVTIEVNLDQAQRVALGSQTGALHLALRGINGRNTNRITRVSVSNLGFTSSRTRKSPKNKSSSMIVVTRGVESKNYRVVSHLKRK